ncbi:DNA primase large subunit [Rhizoctonia solani AG-1 IB]|uniref:DNA primase large subunit n=1 Tax=Thanatephorus cucumeris (strain AG1-IB / isolate 7/3/14) TaxID=1108050 RepID=M5BKC7_THACB|nr:DNA primase large subunit [Rhizoctonia solani AG-1 IB]
MSIDEALTFWRRGFQGGKITDDKFAKEYRYNIRHSYGLEGRRMNYPAKNPYLPSLAAGSPKQAQLSTFQTYCIHDRSYPFASLHRYLVRHVSTHQRIGSYPDLTVPAVFGTSCVRIITNDEPSSLDNHGCPFRHFSPQNLTAMLERSYRITSPAEQAEVIKLVQGHHYQIACTRVFEYTHRKGGTKNGDGLDSQGETVDHPNRYYARSRELYKSMDKDKDNMDIDSKPPVKGESD